MKNKNNLLKFTNIALFITMIAIILVSGTYAKYTSTASGTSATVVANWSFMIGDQDITILGDEKVTFNLFDTINDTKNGEKETDVTEGLIAPGTKGSFEFALKNSSDVTAQYAITLSVDNTDIPIEFSFDGKTWTNKLTDLVAIDILKIGATKNEVVQWRWTFEGDDTALGEAAAAATQEDDVPSITVAATITATQLNNTFSQTDTPTDTPTDEVGENDVDLVLFAGQSNMSGRGNAEEATVCPPGQGYWYKNDSMYGHSKDTEGLYDIVEPFGNESGASTGSLVSAFAKEYYESTGYPIVAISCSIGGTSITQWQSDTTYGQRMKKYVTDALEYLESSGKNVRRAFLVWNQGESDASNEMSTAEYKEYFNSMWTNVKAAGLDKCFIINIGQYRNSSVDYTQIKQALAEVCVADDIEMVSDKFTNATNQMKDTWHYTQIVYNVVGKDAASNIATYYETGTVPTLKQFDASDYSGDPITLYGNLSDWEYTLTGTTVTLNSYIGTEPNVYVYRYYELEGSLYEAVIKRNTSSNAADACFNGNTIIRTIEFEDGVTFEGNIASQQFKGATSLEYVRNIPTLTGSCASIFEGATELREIPTLSAGITSLDSAFRGCQNIGGDIVLPDTITAMSNSFRETKITSVNNIPSTCTMLNYAFFRCTELTTVGDIDGKFTSMAYAFTFDSKLETIGTIKATTVTNMSNAFNGCTALSGIIRIEAEGVTNMSSMLKDVDLTKITLQVPENSTTYETLITEYPTANIETF